MGGETVSQDHDHVEFGPGPVQRLRYRRRWILALNAQARRGEITPEDYRRLREASYNRRFIEGLIEGIERTAKVAGDFIDDVQAWFKKLVDWLIENWPTILKIALSLLLML